MVQIFIFSNGSLAFENETYQNLMIALLMCYMHMCERTKVKPTNIFNNWFVRTLVPMKIYPTILFSVKLITKFELTKTIG